MLVELSIEARELQVVIDNEFALEGQRSSIFQNLDRKVAKGIFDYAKSITLWGYLVDNGASQYVKQYGGLVRHLFPKAVRQELATLYADNFIIDRRLEINESGKVVSQYAFSEQAFQNLANLERRPA
tara:strand:- start:9 stop:389 length:381 start_codon:yes stop_codon:yes gene_type:complete